MHNSKSPGNQVRWENPHESGKYVLQYVGQRDINILYVLRDTYCTVHCDDTVQIFKMH
jgi:hypothetical protein